VCTDATKLKQVLLNLLSNGVKYNRSGGSVTVTAEGRNGDVRIGVADTGPGIAPDALERLFVPFDRLGAEGSGVDGVGLGLSVSKALVEAMSGRMEVESEVDGGSTFRITLPSTRAPEAVPPHPPASLDDGRDVSGTVLYIEDNRSNQTLVTRILEHRPRIRLLSAREGRAGLKAARDHTPDLILLDVHLPDMDGEKVLQELRANGATATIPVVILSADATSEQIRRLTSAGAGGYLTKPLDVRRVLEAVDQILTEPGR
jgi:CheY-like chemotaxis protein